MAFVRKCAFPEHAVPEAVKSCPVMKIVLKDSFILVFLALAIIRVGVTEHQGPDRPTGALAAWALAACNMLTRSRISFFALVRD